MAYDILIIDDEEDIRHLVSGILADEGYQTRCAQNGVEGLELIKKRQPSLVVLDVWLGDSERDGIKVLEFIKKDYPYVPVIMISGHSTIETAVSAIKKGAYDFIEKPFQTDRLLLVIQRAIESSFLKRENDQLRIKARMSPPLVGGSLMSMRQMFEKVCTTNGRLFISSTLGYDQESLAREIHQSSKRSLLPFIAVNCENLNPQYLEAEFFGVELESDGSRRLGFLEKAHTGTLFLENITRLPLNFQAKLVKVLHEQAFVRVSGTHSTEIDVRFMAGSYDDIQAYIADGRLREDLFYRLSVTHFQIPPLSERVSDIPELMEYYIEQSCKAHGRLPRRLSAEATALLQSYPWPGDAQQLRNVAEWIVIMNPADYRVPVGTEDLPPEILSGNAFLNEWQRKATDIVVLPLKEAREVFEREYLLTQVNRFSGNISQTARFIGMERSALHRKLRALGIHDPLQRNAS